jgi:uncharacterized protein YkwD
VRVTGKRRIGAIVGGIAVAALLSACGVQSSAGPAPCDAPSSPPDGLVSAIFNQVNIDRGNAGLAAVTWNKQLSCVATDWSGQMAASGDLHHRDLSAVINSADYRSYHTVGENILRGPGSMTGEAMEAAWMNSPDHRANILSPAFTSIGIGAAGTPSGEIYATQNFGG